jgi:outer membrane cobalamin receptor
VLKGQNITQSAQNVSEAVNKVPGVNMLGRTISIRGGSGFADATGNRVLVLLDDVPMVSPENGGIRWEAMPVEAINQMEIIKGAASASYGSSALNGLINIRTITPKEDKPYNKIFVNYGLYDHHQKQRLLLVSPKNSQKVKNNTSHLCLVELDMFMHLKSDRLNSP